MDTISNSSSSEVNTETIDCNALDRLPKNKLIKMITEIAALPNSPQSRSIISSYLDRMKPNGTKPLAETTTTATSQTKAPRQFDISSYRQRAIAMQIQYEGGPYYGFASQTGECENTIEKHLFDALLKLRFIESRQSCGYSRCGRTDKGVSALGQVIALNIRSAFPLNLPSDIHLPANPNDSVLVPVPKKKPKPGKGSRGQIVASSETCTSPATSSSATDDNGISDVDWVPMREIDYCTIINRALPKDIRVLVWTEVDAGFSSRFSAAGRSYRYFFVKKGLDIAAMQRATEYLLGEHDFRNLCKLDVSNVSNFKREIFSARIAPAGSLFSKSIISDSEEVSVGTVDVNDAPYDSIWMLEISGLAFLWHMIRCIMAVLFLVGERKEKPEIIPWLLNIEQCPAKPLYQMADELPLVLHSCHFDKVSMKPQPNVLWALCSHYEAIWEQHMIASMRALNALSYVKNGCHVSGKALQEFIQALAEKHAIEISVDSVTTGESFECVSSSSGSVPGAYITSIHTDPDDREAKRRKFSDSQVIEAVPTIEPGARIPWSQALRLISEMLGLQPGDTTAKHNSLDKRHCADSYAKRVENLSGSRKGRFDRKTYLHATATEDTGAFFARMRQLGSTDHSVEK